MSSETIKDLMPQTPDLNAERVAKLKELFPDLFTGEGGLNEDELRKLVDPQSINETERYEFRWFGKSQAKRDAFTPSKATLVYNEARSVNPTAAENLIIEGENLEVLKLLLSAYREEIKCIYIDPPYNTGKDFVYSDNYTEARKPYWEQTGVTENGVRVDTNADTHGRFHSNWMNMMYSRLLVARQLLKPDGVIFISIDDNEVHNLRRLCDEIFGGENFVTSVTWQKKVSPSNDAQWFSSDHDQILVYAKAKEIWRPLRIKRNEKQTEYYKNPDNDPRGSWNSATYTCNKSRQERPNLYYPIKNPNTNEDVYPKETAVWAYSKEVHKKHVEENRIYWGADGNAKFPRMKHFLSEAKDVVPRSIWHYADVGHTQEGTQELMTLLPNTGFTSPKPSRLIRRVLEISTSTDENDTVLDFFGGSGSTGQATVELNEEDGGNRKFILVQLPELTDQKSEAYKAGYKKISDITIERNKLVVERIIKAKREAHPNLFENPDDTDALKGLGFKVFNLEKSYFPRTDWSPDANLSEAENVRALKEYIADKESQLNLSFDRDKLLTEVLLKEGFKLNYAVAPYPAVTSNQILHITAGDKEALVCLDPTLELETVEHFKTHTELKFICLERALDTTKKWNLHHFLGEKFKAF